MQYDSLWAKKEEREGQYYWLPLTVHLDDTGLVAGWLWNHWLCEGQRKYLLSQMRRADSGNELAGTVDEDIAEAFIRFLGAVHDIGKATPVFQTKRGFSCSYDLDQLLTEHLENAGFTGISDLKLANPEKSHHALAGEVILHRLGVTDDIASIVGAHHGKPVDSQSACENQKAYPANYYQSENTSTEIAVRWRNTHAFFLEKALQIGGLKKTDLPIVSQPGQVILSGILIMADWIASNETYFPLLSIDRDQISSEEINSRFQEGISRWYKDLPHEVQKPESAKNLYMHRFGFYPRSFQQIIFDSIAELKDPGIVVIEAPTGGGKTEAALAAVEQLAAVSNRSGLFFGLPTQATSNGIFDRIVHWTQSVSSDYGDSSIRLVHGKAALNKTMQDIRKKSAATNVDIDDNDSGNVLVNEWFSGRKTASLDDFVVGTVDQFLMMALKQKHFALRHLGFSRKVIVIDEVHAYDAYMQQYLKEALRWAGAYHVPVVLLSATLPSQIRNSLIEAYLLGRGARKRELKALMENTVNSYPMLTVSDGNQIIQVTDFQKEKEKTIQVRTLSDDVLLDKITELMQDEGVIGIIVNTVKRAQMIAAQCAERFGRDCVELLHASFIATDRSLLEERILSMIGKGASRPKKKIIIGTQVLEQSLDIDFDVLITDLCPMDLLIQRMGRLHRHNILRPAKHAVPVTYVLGTSPEWDFDKGSSFVYGDYLLVRTQELLPSEIHVPTDVSALVQEVYGKDDKRDDLENDESMAHLYNQFKSAFNNERIKKEKKADIFRMDDPKLIIKPEKNNLIGMLHSDLPDSPSEEFACAQVRDTHETIEVIALRRTKNGYCTFQNDKNLADSIEKAETGQIIAQQTLRLPYSVTAYGQIDKVIRELEDYNRKNLADWQKQPWLKGALGILFDEQNQFILGDTKIQYDSFLGLRVLEKEEK